MLFRELGTKHYIIGFQLFRLGCAALEQADTARAAALFHDALIEQATSPHLAGIVLTLAGVATLDVRRGNVPRAAQLLGAVDGLLAGQPLALTAPEQELVDRALVAVRAQLDRDMVAQAWAAGRWMTMEQAVDYALQGMSMAGSDGTEQQGPTIVSSPSVCSSYPVGLSAREVEVPRLLADGLRYAEIAACLGISRHTVNAHLRRIYGKLEVRSRNAATRFALAHRLA